MNRTALMAALIGAVAAFACPAFAQKVGQTCTNDTENIVTTRSTLQSEGVIQCIPDTNGNYFWQPMGAGVARYDATASCITAGTLRWNGSAIQYCDGTGWQSMGGGLVGRVHSAGNTFYCDLPYQVVQHHWDCGCSNNATWYDCELP